MRVKIVNGNVNEYGDAFIPCIPASSTAMLSTMKWKCLQMAAYLAAVFTWGASFSSYAETFPPAEDPADAEPSVTREPYGRMEDGTEVDLYTLSNRHGLEATIMTLGATLTTVKAPDRRGYAAVITLHKDSFEGYRKGHPLLGSVVGRFANRIADARFTIDGQVYPLVANSGRHHIHGGGRLGFQGKVWEARMDPAAGPAAVRLSLTSPDGEAGYPGTVKVDVLYKLTAANELIMEYTATTDQPTHINLTNHAYWNLGGAGVGVVGEHLLRLGAEAYLPTDEDLIPTGEIRPVAGSALDFRKTRPIGERAGELPRARYDHCYVLSPNADRIPAFVARVEDPGSGRVMEVFTTQCGVQLFTGNPGGFCLETQHFPNAPNETRFPSTLLRPGERFHQVTMHRFSVAR